MLGTLAAAVVATPFVATWSYDAHRRAVSEQAPAPAGGSDARPRTPAARHPSAPVVLAYHDVAPHPHSRYTVSPERLDAQLSALRATGHRALSTEEFVRYLATGRPPAPRSVYLTFDDGTRGLWAYADPILAKHRMKAATYLITGMVGTRRPYYLTWPEVHRMAGSGRWDFQAHTHDGHHRAAVDASGRHGSVLANRLWRPGPGRLETEAEYRRRVEADLDRSARAFAHQGLPAPRLFAYPFSETGARTNLAGRNTSVLERLLRARYAATLTNTTPRPLPAGPRAAAAGQVRRLEVLRSTTPEELLRAVDAWASSTPGDAPRPLRQPGGWEFPGSPPGTGLAALTGLGSPHRTYVSAVHRPMSTADWSSYRVTARADGLRGTGTGVSVEVGHGGGYPCTLTVGARGLRVTLRRPDGERRALATRRLAPSAAHRLTLRTAPGTVRVTVDTTSFVVRLPERATAARTSGGIALGVRNESPGTPWPRFTSLRVSPGST
ncbi:polysaccharide deacetylase family protein [Streptomyces poonensis]|uniref:polysaccharide deacetylase family protein n=1 Tax=Streptomyces poonensis TaxID=68255 RepID=UPI001E4182A3|nr:polysaccharide deacetylase family protein [Streptomyces poonensis]